MGRGGDARRDDVESLFDGTDAKPLFDAGTRQGLPMLTVVDRVANAVAAVAQSADVHPHRSMTFFDADAEFPPHIPIHDYLQRWMRYAECGEELVVVALVYMNRSRIPVSALNMHRLLLAALMLAAKWRQDYFLSNEYYAALGGVTLREMNRLEAALLCSLDWNIHVSEEEYRATLSELAKDNGMPEMRESWPLTRDPAAVGELLDVKADGALLRSIPCMRRAVDLVWELILL
eukprot:TRINITY_DN2230_c0_g2_i8.p1 TRINITY_DN2230_c0_g2~~TRINITY_DN2230_c0_g2_i8.p1  ORF type:complete len:233 (+),score=75.55 TRINITY_DN2230_c0_g2_i8:109-807(+)